MKVKNNGKAPIVLPTKAGDYITIKPGEMKPFDDADWKDLRKQQTVGFLLESNELEEVKEGKTEKPTAPPA